MDKTLVIFITHNFKKVLLHNIGTLVGSEHDVMIIFDGDQNLKGKLKQLEEEDRAIVDSTTLVKSKRMNTSYDNPKIMGGGHSMYIRLFKEDPKFLEKYKHIWLVENDVHFSGNFSNLINAHSTYDYDLLTAEYGCRGRTWAWPRSVKGMKHHGQIGVLAVIMRFSSRLLKHLVTNIDKTYSGYLEAILPQICLNYDFSIQTFIPNFVSELRVTPTKYSKRITKDFLDDTYVHRNKNQIYHPIKV